MFIPLDNGKKAITEVMFDAETARQGVDSAIKYHNQHPELTVCASYHAVTLASTPDILFILRCKMPVEVFHVCCMGTYCTFSDTSWTCTVHVQTGLYDLFFCMWWGVNYSIRYLQHDSVWFYMLIYLKCNRKICLSFCGFVRVHARSVGGTCTLCVAQYWPPSHSSCPARTHKHTPYGTLPFSTYASILANNQSRISLYHSTKYQV